MACWGQPLETETPKSPKTRHRFGFFGKRKRAPQTGSLSQDEILESLTRQASSQVGFGEEQQKGFDVLVDEEEPTTSYGQSVMSDAQSMVPRSRSLGRFAFLLMFLGGLLVVWLYSSGTWMLDLSSITKVGQNIGVHAIFNNPTQIGIISFVALVAALWVAKKRKNSRLTISP